MGPQKGGVRSTAKHERWLTPEGLSRVRQWVGEGLTRKELAARMGIGRTAMYRWNRTYPELAAALRPQRTVGENLTQSVLYRSAIGGYQTTVSELPGRDGTTVRIRKTSYIPGNPCSAIRWSSLRGRMNRNAAEAGKVVVITEKNREWLTPERLAVVAGWARIGMTQETIAENMGISERTLRRWKQKCPELASALNQGNEVADIMVEDSLYRHAVGFMITETEEREVHDEVVSRVRKTRYIPGSITGQIFWLKKRQPRRWGDLPPEQEDPLQGFRNYLDAVYARHSPFAPADPDDGGSLIGDGGSLIGDGSCVTGDGPS